MCRHRGTRHCKEQIKTKQFAFSGDVVTRTKNITSVGAQTKAQRGNGDASALAAISRCFQRFLYLSLALSSLQPWGSPHMPAWPQGSPALVCIRTAWTHVALASGVRMARVQSGFFLAFINCCLKEQGKLFRRKTAL